MGGNPPMGYDVKDRQLVVNDTDAATIRRIFSYYLEERTVPTLLDRLQRENIRTAARYSAKGNHYGDRPFTRGHIYKLLTNPIYIGRVPHKTTSHRGQHQAIVDKAVWDAVQAQLASNIQGPRNRRRRSKPQTHLLEGLLVSQSGNRFIPSHANKGKRRYRYYVEQSGKASEQTSTAPPIRLPANEIEAATIGAVQSVLGDHRGLLHRLGELAILDGDQTLAAARTLNQSLNGRLDQDATERVRKMVRSVEYRRDLLVVTITMAGMCEVLGLHQSGGGDGEATNQPDDAGDFSLTFPLRTRRRGPQTKLVVEGSSRVASPNQSLITAVVRARDWADRLISGEVHTMAEICAVEGFTDSYVGQVLPLAFLPPRTVEAILAGTHEPTLTANSLIWWREASLRW